MERLTKPVLIFIVAVSFLAVGQNAVWYYKGVLDAIGFVAFGACFIMATVLRIGRKANIIGWIAFSVWAFLAWIIGYLYVMVNGDSWYKLPSYMHQVNMILFPSVPLTLILLARYAYYALLERKGI